jgi:hypothetical protein
MAIYEIVESGRESVIYWVNAVADCIRVLLRELIKVNQADRLGTTLKCFLT